MAISVVIPLYNKEKYIARTIKSVLSQLNKEDEIIIVNDGSKDHSVEQVKRMKDHRIKLFHQENGGASSARNKGVTLASNSLIAFIDADDIWYQDYLYEMRKLIKEYPDAVVYGANYDILEKHKKSMMSYPGIDKDTGLITNYFESAITYTPLWTSAVIVRKEAFMSVGGFSKDCKICEDVDLWCRLALYGKIAYRNKPLALYNRDVEGMLSREKMHSCLFPFLANHFKVSEFAGNPISYESVTRFIQARRLVAVKYALFNANNPIEARDILRNMKPSKEINKQYRMLYVATYLPYRSLMLVRKVQLVLKRSAILMRNVLFKISLHLLPSFMYSKTSTRVKSWLAKGVLPFVGERINWGKKIKMSTNISIGNDSGVGNHAFLNGPISIGNDVMMGTNVKIFRRNHVTSRTDIPMRVQGMTKPKKLVIEDDVWIGDDVTIIPSVDRIGRGSIIGTGAVVTHNIPEYSVCVGNPGRVVRNRKS